MNRHQHPVALALALGLLGFAAGCRTAKPITSYLIDERSAELEKHSAGLFGIRGLDLVEVNHERRSGRLLVQVQLRNTSGGHLAIEHSVEWYDENNFVIGDPTPWKATNLGRGEFYTLRFTGPTEKATQMRLNVRKSDPVR